MERNTRHHHIGSSIFVIPCVQRYGRAHPLSAAVWHRGAQFQDSDRWKRHRDSGYLRLSFLRLIRRRIDLFSFVLRHTTENILYESYCSPDLCHVSCFSATVAERSRKAIYTTASAGKEQTYEKYTVGRCEFLSQVGNGEDADASFLGSSRHFIVIRPFITSRTVFRPLSGSSVGVLQRTHKIIPATDISSHFTRPGICGHIFYSIGICQQLKSHQVIQAGQGRRSVEQSRDGKF